jgi:hypothetical protein
MATSVMRNARQTSSPKTFSLNRSIRPAPHAPMGPMGPSLGGTLILD